MSSCVSCNRKFAAPSASAHANLCRTCRSTRTTDATPTGASKSPSDLKFSSKSSNSQKSLLTSTPKLSKSGGDGNSGSRQGSGGTLGSGRNLVPMKCKICNTCFRYRRCLFRHLRENHPGIDQDNLMQYIDMNASGTGTDGGASTSSPLGKAGAFGGKRTLSQRQGKEGGGDDSTSSSLHVTIGSEVGELTDSSVAGSILGSDGNVAGSDNGG